MRVTNSMMTRNLIHNINERLEHMTKLSEQINSTKKISRPSDDPIVATRILKFRTTISEIMQYKSNGESAKNWVSMTEGAMNETRSIYMRMYDKSIQASNDVLNFSNRHSIASEFRELQEQITTQANVSYAGRYIFSGFKTDRSVMYEETTEYANSYKIDQVFEKKDIQKIDKAFNNTKNEVYRIRLAYSDVSDITFNPALAPVPTPAKSTDADAYNAAAGPKFLTDTGELILTKDMVDNFQKTTVTYEKKKFNKGDIRPELYFDVEDPEGVKFTQKEENIDYQISYNQKFTVNLRAKDVFLTDMKRELEEIIRETDLLEKPEAELSDDDKISLKILGQRYRDFAAKMQKYNDNMSNEIALIGAKESRLLLTINRLEDDRMNFGELLSETEDTNIPQALIEMTNVSNAYSMSLASGAKIIQPSLLDFLR